jgi:hypothetical protein
MPRADLLALSFDDLTALTNRGTVKRAQREVEGKECTATLAESGDGDLVVKWSDGFECHLPAGAVVREGRCSCAAVGLCRHLIRTVLLYQLQIAPVAPGQAAPQAVEPWDPGGISDEELARHFKPRDLARARQQFDQGLLVELVRGAKPNARFHLQACLVRFLVPGDPRYTHCDCPDAAPCGHVPLAVWAFRKLDRAKTAGVIATAEKPMPAPVELLDEIEAAAAELPEFGVSGMAAAFTSRLSRLAEKCRAADLAWPADVLAELLQQRERYAEHDARFAPERVAELLGELLIRCDAIRRDTGALPQLIIRGTCADRVQPLDKARFVGLGCGVRIHKRGVELNAYLQDSDTGSVAAVCKDFADNQDDKQPPKSFAELAQGSAVKGTAFAALGAGQLLIQKAKRDAGHRLMTARTDATVQPQAFAWENLRAPVLVEEFAELDARLSALPPSSLRPRRVAEDFHVCKVARVEAADFDAPTQTVYAVVSDERGQQARVLHPYTSRGRAGAEALLGRLRRSPQDVCFVSGPVRRGAGGLMIQPVCVVFQDSKRRMAVQPWVDAAGPAAGTPDETQADAGAAWGADALADYLSQLQAALSDLLLLGLQRADGGSAKQWRELQRAGEATGFARLGRAAGLVAGELEAKARTLQWDWRPASDGMLRLAALARLAQDLVG